MSNSNHDLTPPEYVPLPKRMPNTEWDKVMIEKENASTQKPK